MFLNYYLQVVFLHYSVKSEPKYSQNKHVFFYLKIHIHIYTYTYLYTVYRVFIFHVLLLFNPPHPNIYIIYKLSDMFKYISRMFSKFRPYYISVPKPIPWVDLNLLMSSLVSRKRNSLLVNCRIHGNQ